MRLVGRVLRDHHGPERRLRGCDRHAFRHRGRGRDCRRHDRAGTGRLLRIVVEAVAAGRAEGHREASLLHAGQKPVPVVGEEDRLVERAGFVQFPQRGDGRDHSLAVGGDRQVARDEVRVPGAGEIDDVVRRIAENREAGHLRAVVAGERRRLGGFDQRLDGHGRPFDAAFGEDLPVPMQSGRGVAEGDAVELAVEGERGAHARRDVVEILDRIAGVQVVERFEQVRDARQRPSVEQEADVDARLRQRQLPKQPVAQRRDVHGVPFHRDAGFALPRRGDVAALFAGRDQFVHRVREDADDVGLVLGERGSRDQETAERRPCGEASDRLRRDRFHDPFLLRSGRSGHEPSAGSHSSNCAFDPMSRRRVVNLEARFRRVGARDARGPADAGSPVRTRIDRGLAAFSGPGRSPEPAAPCASRELRGMRDGSVPGRGTESELTRDPRSGEDSSVAPRRAVRRRPAADGAGFGFAPRGRRAREGRRSECVRTAPGADREPAAAVRSPAGRKASRRMAASAFRRFGRLGGDSGSDGGVSQRRGSRRAACRRRSRRRVRRADRARRADPDPGRGPPLRHRDRRPGAEPVGGARRTASFAARRAGPGAFVPRRRKGVADPPPGASRGRGTAPARGSGSGSPLRRGVAGRRAVRHDAPLRRPDAGLGDRNGPAQSRRSALPGGRSRRGSLPGRRRRGAGKAGARRGAGRQGRRVPVRARSGAARRGGIPLDGGNSGWRDPAGFRTPLENRSGGNGAGAGCGCVRAVPSARRLGSERRGAREAACRRAPRARAGAALRSGPRPVVRAARAGHGRTGRVRRRSRLARQGLIPGARARTGRTADTRTTGGAHGIYDRNRRRSRVAARRRVYGRRAAADGGRSRRTARGRAGAARGRVSERSGARPAIRSPAPRTPGAAAPGAGPMERRRSGYAAGGRRERRLRAGRASLALDSDGSAHQRATDRDLSFANRVLRGSAGLLCACRGGLRPGRGRSGGRDASERRLSGSAARDPVCAQGHPRRPRHARRLGRGTLRGPDRRVRFRRRGAVARRRRGAARQVVRGRAGERRHMARPQDPQSVESRRRGQRLQRRVGLRDGGRPVRILDRNRDARVHRDALGAVRRDRLAADVRARVPGRVHGALLVARQGGSDLPRRRGRRNGAARDRRGRPTRPGFDRRPLQSRRDGAARRDSYRLPAGGLCGGSGHGSRSRGAGYGSRPRAGRRRGRVAGSSLSRADGHAPCGGRRRLRGAHAFRRGRAADPSGRRRLAQPVPQGAVPVRRGPRAARPAAPARHGGRRRPVRRGRRAGRPGVDGPHARREQFHRTPVPGASRRVRAGSGSPASCACRRGGGRSGTGPGGSARRLPLGRLVRRVDALAHGTASGGGAGRAGASAAPVFRRRDAERSVTGRHAAPDRLPA